MLAGVFPVRIPRLNRNERLQWSDLFGLFGWVSVAYAGSATVAVLLYLTYLQSGIGVLMAMVPLLGMMLATLHFFFRQQEADEAVLQAGAAALVHPDRAFAVLVRQMAHESDAVGLADRLVRGFEALVRWQHPHDGAIGPTEFLPIAEEAGLVLKLTDNVMHTACRQLREMGCLFGQGYLLSRPQPAQDVRLLLAAGSVTPAAAPCA